MPVLQQTPLEPHPPRPCPWCPPGAQMRMTRSDIFLNTLECDAVFESAVIFESYCGW